MQKENRIGYYILLITIVLAPLSFWPSQYIVIETVKAAVISLGVLLSSIFLIMPALKSGRWSLPPRSMTWIPILIVASVIASSVASGHFVKSFFGQGFELGAGGFTAVLFVAYLVAYAVVARKAGRTTALYAAVIVPFLVLFVFHALRLIFGPGFATLGFLNGLTSSVLGSWYGLAMYAVAVAIISVSAIMLMTLSRIMKVVNWTILVLALLTAAMVNSSVVWLAAAAAFLGLAIYISLYRPKPAGTILSASLKRIAWLPVVIFILSGLLWWSNAAVGAGLSALNMNYGETALSWRGTLDVAAGELKSSPLFGAGPNRFIQAYLANKPGDVNQTDAWGLEFSTGFGLIPTFFVTEGVIGGVLWILFFVFFGIVGAKSLRRQDQGFGASADIDPRETFVITSSFFSAAFLWLVSVISVPPHAVLFLAFVFSGVWLGASVYYGKQKCMALIPAPISRAALALRISSIVILVALALWAIVCAKNTVALAYFDSGVERLTAGDAVSADGDFKVSLGLNPMDVYWQGRAEAALNEAGSLVSALASSSTSPTSKAMASQAIASINAAYQYSENAIKSDPDNYYNYISEARVGEAAASLNMANGYDTAVKAYDEAIKLNPGNPSLYVSLAQFQATYNKLDDALQTVGASLQVKNNYINSVFLLSQIEAAKGNLADAITAAQFATTLNSGNSLLYFQLGLLQYTAGKYADAADSLTKAVSLQSDYANAQYYLGLSDARLGKNSDAIALFEALNKSNPGNQSVEFVLGALEAGKSPFASSTAGSQPSVKSQPPVK